MSSPPFDCETLVSLFTCLLRVGVTLVATKVEGTACVLEGCWTVLGSRNGSILAANVFRDTVGTTGSSGLALGVVHQGANYFLSKVLWFMLKVEKILSNNSPKPCRTCILSRDFQRYPSTPHRLPCNVLSTCLGTSHWSHPPQSGHICLRQIRKHQNPCCR